MNGHHRGNRPPAASADKLSCFAPGALFLQKTLQHRDRHIVGLLVDIDEFGKCAGLRDGFRCGNKRVRDGQHHVPGSYSTGHDGKAQGIRADAHGYRMACATEGSKSPLEVFHYWAANEAGRKQGSAKYAGELLLEFHVWRNQIQKRNAIWNTVRVVHWAPSQFHRYNAEPWPDFQSRSRWVEHLW